MKALIMSVACLCAILISALNVHSEVVKGADSVKAAPWTELMQAAADGDAKTLLRVLKKGADPNIRSSNGWTPLMWAADGGHANAANILLDNRADINLADDKGTTALMLAVMRKQHAVIDVMLKRGASPNAADKKSVTPLMIAASNGDTTEAGKLLALGAKVDARDKSGQTALMRASNAHVAKLLIEKGADVRVRSDSGMTPLMEAARHGNSEVIVALLQNGADIRTKDNEGRTAHDWGSYYNYGGIDDHHIILEIFSGNPEKVTLCKAAILGDENKAADLIRQGLTRDEMEKCDGPYGPDYEGTPLEWAVKDGHLGLVKLLLEKGASVSSKGNSLVFTAAHHGRPDILKLLLEHGALRNPDRDAEYWENICLKGSKQILQLLQQYDSQLCALYDGGAGPKGCSEIIRHYAARLHRKYDDAEKGVPPELISDAASEKDSTVLKCLLEAAGKDGLPATSLQRAMEVAARTNRPDNIELLHKYGADVNKSTTYDARGITPLMWASMDGNLKAARKLIEQGADVHVRSKEGQTAIMYAQAHGCREIVKLLKSRGAHNDSNLSGAAATGDIEAAKKLLRNGADIDAQDSLGWTPLLWACATGQTKMIRVLLDTGALIKDRGRILYSYPHERGGYVGYFTPLEVAAHNGHAEVVRLLMKHLKEAPGSTQVGNALHIALQKGHASVVKVLVAYGADVNAKTSTDQVEGSAALIAAVEAGHRDLVELLLKRGANPNSYEIAQGDSYYEPSALQIATKKGYERIRQLLLRYGADYSKFP